MWTKGAVVVIKRGDEEMANAITEGSGVKTVNSKDYNDLETAHELLRRRRTEDILDDIIDAEEEYGHNWVPPKWAKWIFEGMAFVVYWVCIFIDKYLRL